MTHALGKMNKNEQDLLLSIALLPEDSQQAIDTEGLMRLLTTSSASTTETSELYSPSDSNIGLSILKYHGGTQGIVAHDIRSVGL